jgi:hypothetical protein
MYRAMRWIIRLALVLRAELIAKIETARGERR